MAFIRWNPPSPSETTGAPKRTQISTGNIKPKLRCPAFEKIEASLFKTKAQQLPENPHPEIHVKNATLLGYIKKAFQMDPKTKRQDFAKFERIITYMRRKHQQFSWNMFFYNKTQVVVRTATPKTCP